MAEHFGVVAVGEAGGRRREGGGARAGHRLAEARREIRALEGMIPICAHCKKVRNDKGYWEQVEGYLTRRKLALFSHGICPDCLQEVRREVESLTPPRPEAP